MKYAWRFDKRGRRTAPPIAPTAIQPPKATRGPLEELEAVGQWISQHPENGVNLETLERMRVIPSPPSWSYLRLQLQKVRTNESALTPEALAEVNEAATTYLDALCQNAAPLENAIYSATVLSAFHEDGAQYPMIDSLRLLEFSLSRARTREDVLRILEIVFDKLVSEFAIGKEVQPGRFLLTEGHIERWLEALTTTQKLIVTKVEASEKNYDAATLAWETWKNWALQIWPRPPKPSEIDVWNLATRMAGRPPGSILWDDPTSMTISAWTDALHSALTTNQYRDQAREWFVPFALVQLGFIDQANAVFLRQWNPEAEGRPLVPQLVPEGLRRFANQIPQTSSRRFSLVVIYDSGTHADRWLPWNGMGCLVYLATQLPDFNEELRGLTPWPSASYVLFAFLGVPDPDEARQALDVYRRLQSQSDTFKNANAVLMGDYAIARETPLPFYYLETPPSLQEAVRHLDSMPAESLRSRETPQERQS